MTTPPGDLALITFAALWGAMAGALLPRAVHRFSVPWEERDGGWRTTCPGGHPIRGWLGRARCARCAEQAQAPERPADASPAGPAAHAASTASTASPAPTAPTAAYAPGAFALPLLTAVVCAALAAATGVRPELAVWLLLAPAGVLLAAVDLRVRRLPDPLTLPLAAATLVLLGPAALLPEHAGDWTTALLGALALGAGYLVLHLVNPGGMAYGDVKLALSVGAVLGWYGWATVMLGTFAAFLLGALYGGALAVVGRAGRGTMIAFGPFMLAGAFAGLLVGAYAA
ncbi:prepilin peptidase [Streptomyces rishiriensis]|uniref:Leader peptidase (Prepilin peptidase)/N-methyltransferase n=1 Tax=Streptomyces rishiriensis TaxID=68264 RepID=A0ABU0NUD7_STRRH|nr:A24 family peptidase [Streptomyces rishiriensis]MDQ0582729.1 leader peptidase (prepilin peptidase)/N-methyltransferase [Streptomyces rishiriensis]